MNIGGAVFLLQPTFQKGWQIAVYSVARLPVISSWFEQCQL
jgi:hypothetical protein